jgi:hypothetical protein
MEVIPLASDERKEGASRGCRCDSSWWGRYLHVWVQVGARVCRCVCERGCVCVCVCE